jgi:hypothetical protein
VPFTVAGQWEGGLYTKQGKTEDTHSLGFLNS